MKTSATIAANRFGLGARPGELSQIASDPRGWLHEQLGASPPAALADRPSSVQLVLDAMEMAAQADSAETTEMYRQAYLTAMSARASVVASSLNPFRERLVWFWSNHFAVSTTKRKVLPLAGPFEREVIRANLSGQFGDMLLASTRHPAMLLYLDNVRSIGPRSPVGRRRNKGLNENLAREILELHTLGVDGGYDQADVIALAKLLTGWGLGAARSRDGAFHFEGDRHEPGPKTVLGKTYRDGGERDGVAALADLAAHPATGHHVATKLVRHFVSDDPDLASVAEIASVFQRTGGDLGAVHAALIDLSAAWDPEPRKLKSPRELVISAARALNRPGAGMEMVQSMKMLGQAPFSPPSPQGWPDVAAEWLGPESVLNRVEWARRVAREIAPAVGDVSDLAAAVLGDGLRPRTLRAIRRAGDPEQALALLFVSPDFQRR